MTKSRKKCPIDCRCLCHDTGGGVHDHPGRPCPGKNLTSDPRGRRGVDRPSEAKAVDPLRAICAGCGHMAVHHLNGEGRCLHAKYNRADEAAPCSCPSFECDRDHDASGEPCPKRVSAEDKEVTGAIDALNGLTGVPRSAEANAHVWVDADGKVADRAGRCAGCGLTRAWAGPWFEYSRGPAYYGIISPTPPCDPAWPNDNYSTKGAPSFTVRARAYEPDARTLAPLFMGNGRNATVTFQPVAAKPASVEAKPDNSDEVAKLYAIVEAAGELLLALAKTNPTVVRMPKDDRVELNVKVQALAKSILALPTS